MISGAIQAEVSRFLEANIVAVIATSNRETLNNSMVYYTSDGDNNFYFETLETTNKCRNLKKHPQAALVIADIEYLISAQIRGSVVELRGEEKKRIRKKLVEKRRDFGVKKWPPHDLVEFKNKSMSTNKVTFKITPDQFFFFNLGATSYPASLSSPGYVVIGKK